MFRLELIVRYLIEFRNQLSRKLISRNGLMTMGAIVMILLLLIFGVSFNLITQMSRQDDLTTLGILRSTRALDNVNVEILHLVMLLDSREAYSKSDIKNQVNVLESRFNILMRQHSLDILPTNLRLQMLNLVTEWNNISPVIDQLSVPSSTDKIDRITRKLLEIHRRLTDLILQNQNLNFQEYEILRKSRQNMIVLFVDVFILFLLVISLVVYLVIRLMYEHKNMLQDRIILMNELEQKNDILQRMAMIDELTQVANRRYFNIVLHEEWRRLLGEHRPLSIVLCDIDYFKLYNDYYGHQQGDICLHQVAQVMKYCVHRSSDLIARYGGEEFIILLPNTPLDGAIAVVSNIQETLKKAHINHINSIVSNQVTLSLGIACMIPSTLLNPELLISQADKALYLAKQGGRNQYQWIDPNSP